MPIDEKVLIEELKKPEVLEKVFTLVSETDLFKNKTKSLQEQYYEQNKGKEHGYAFGLVDKALEEVGYKKPDGVQTSAHAVQIAKENLQLKKDLDILKAEKSGQNVDEKVKAIETKYQKELADLTTTYTSKLSEYEKQLNQERTTNQIQNNLTKLSAELGKLTFIASIPKNSIDEYAEFQLQQLAKFAVVENGVTIWRDAQGKNILNSNHLNASTEEVLKSVFKNFIQVGTAGGGAQGTGANSRLEGDILILPNPNKITNKIIFASEFEAAWRAQGKAADDPKRNDVFKATKKHYNIDALTEK